MDFDYLKVVLNDFTMKQVFVIHWLHNNLDKNMHDRNARILHLLQMHLNDELNGWTTLKIEHALMAIDELRFLNKNDEKQLAEDLCTYLTKEKCSNVILQPYVNKCCDSRVKKNIGRKITVFGINNIYTTTIINGVCHTCKRKYSHNYFIEDEEKFVTTESIFGPSLVYMGGDYGYEKSLIKWLSNSILYLHSGFENFCKCYNETRKWTCNDRSSNEENISPTRVQDFWLLYNYVIVSFFYTDKTVIKIPSSWWDLEITPYKMPISSFIVLVIVKN